MFAMSAAIAQRDSLPSSSRDRLSIVAGFADSQRRDAAVSPLTFGGVGYSSAVDYRHVGDRMVVAVTATWDAQRSRPQDDVIAASERVAQGALRVATLRRIGDGRPWVLAAGISTAAWGSGTEHRYADPTASRANFLSAFVTLGPTLAIGRSIAGGALRFDFDAPALGFADRTYSVAKTDYSPVQLRVIGPRELHALNGATSYATSPHRGFGVIYAYRFSVLNYRDAQPLRAASQAVSIGLTRSVGTAR
jgi:hypothetical protein